MKLRGIMKVLGAVVIMTGAGNAALAAEPAPDYLAEGQKKYQAKDYQGALADFDLAVNAAPRRAEAYYWRGVTKIDLKLAKSAITDFDQAIRLKKNYADAYYERAYAKSEIGDYQGALKDLDRVIALKPDHVNAYTERGWVKLQLGDNRGALKDSDKAVALNPNWATPYRVRGDAKNKLQDLGGAIADWQKAIQLDAGFAKILNPEIDKAQAALKTQAHAGKCAGELITTQGYVINWTEWGERYGIANPFLIISGPEYQGEDGKTSYYGLYNFPHLKDAGNVTLTGCVPQQRSPYRGLKYFSEVYEVQPVAAH
ncbi:MAG: tetratricopeptide repeat protein [Gammaproteobacteria bacterium]